MDSVALQKHLLRLFERHDIELELDEDWLVTDGDFPAIRASWSDGVGDQPGRLDIDVVVSEEQQIEESFAGIGEGDPACRHALAAFEASVLPVLLAGCWYVTDQRKLDIAAWDIGLRTFDVFIGPYGDDVPPGLTDALGAALKAGTLSPQLHWVRWFAQRDGGSKPAIEALLDNHSWPVGEQTLAALNWPTPAGDYRARGFLMLDVRDY